MEKKVFKKLDLKKSVLAKLNEANMKEIKGGTDLSGPVDHYGCNGAFNTHFACMTIRANCDTQNSCTKVGCF